MTATMGRAAVEHGDGRLPPVNRPWLRRGPVVPVLTGALGLIISMIGITTPSLWYDEAATVSSTTRSWPQLWAELGNVDAVHGLYYGLIHLIFDVVGYSPLSLRAPSAIAVAITAALVVVLGRQLGRPRLAIIAGIVFCLLPRVTWMGTEGRSYALTATFAALATVALLRALRMKSWSSWIAYGFVAAVSVTLFLYLALVIAAHGLTVALLARSRRRGASDCDIHDIRRWLAAAGGAAIASAPFALVVIGQGGQLSWIKPLGTDTVTGVFQEQWFTDTAPFAVVAWALMTIGVIATATRARGRLFKETLRASPNDAAPRSILAVLVPAVTVPTMLLLLESSFRMPIYEPRYLTMCTPFVALAIALGIGVFRWRAVAPVTLLLIAVLSVPQIVAQRLPEAKEASAWPAVAALIGQQRAETGPATVTAIIYGALYQHPKATTRVIQYTYPAAFRSTVDVTLVTPAAQTAQLWETRTPVAASVDQLASADVTYLITSTSRDARPETTRVMQRVGWHVTGQWHFTRINVLRYERD